MQEHAQNQKKHDFNYYISRFFLNNGRLTFLIFVLVVLLGTIATFSLKTTGFPNPQIDALTIFTRYPGASSQSVLNEVSIPIENAVKTVDGVSGYESTSSNESSVVFVSVSGNANADSVKSEIDSAIASVKLPSTADKPVISKPEISGPDFIFTIANTDGDKEELYKASQAFKNNVEKLKQTSSVEIANPIKPVVKIRPDFAALAQRGADLNSLRAQLASFGQNSPVGSDITIDNQSTAINLSLNESTIEDLKTFPLALADPQNPTATPTFVQLQDVAEVATDYEFQNAQPSFIGVSTENGKETLQGLVIQVKAVENTDQNQFDTDIKEANQNLDSAVYQEALNITGIQTDESKPLIIRNYAVKDDNQEQVQEVIKGLVGGPLEVDNSFIAQIGWIFGALQLVFISMFLFVSWRAALISAFSIPLSLGFTSIYLFFTGESFNTLVLFSLVLVIGLVVDPTLVVLEAIQRKIDSGLKGRDAVLAGISDVGIGLFASTLTNIIVFLPFGLISGVIGQIFAYIPMTIVPAIIGSYVVAIIFLSWFGGVVLARSPKSTDSEEENLWPIAKGVINLNKRILHARRIWRVLIIVVLSIIPIVTMWAMFNYGFIKQTDFSTPKDSQFIIVSTQFKPTVSAASRIDIKREFVGDLLTYNGVEQAFPTGAGGSYFVQLEKRENDNRPVSTELAKTMNEELSNKYSESFFSISVNSSGPGSDASAFPVQIGIYPQGQTVDQSTAVAVGQTLKNVCKTDSGFEISDNCSEDNRVITGINDGYTGLENRLIQVNVNRQNLISKGLASFTNPQAQANSLTAAVQSSIITQTDAKIPTNFVKVATVTQDQQDIDVIIDPSLSSSPSITTQNQLNNALILGGNTAGGAPTTLNTIAELVNQTPQNSIARTNGSTLLAIRGQVKDAYSDQGSIAAIQQAVIDYYQQNDGEKAKALGLEADGVRAVTSSTGPDFAQSFQELILALLLAIVIIYTILVVFFGSFTKPLIILYTIPLSFIGLSLGLAFLGGGQLGFLEIIGIIILVGLVVNVALYLMDSARTYMLVHGYDQKKAIATAAGIRFRSVTLTKITAISSLAPLAIYSEFYRSIAVVIMFGLLTSGFTSLITTPILYVFFNWLSDLYHKFNIWNKIFFISPLSIVLPLGLIMYFAFPDQRSVTLPLTGILLLVSVLIVITYLIVFWIKTPADNKPINSPKAPRATAHTHQ